MSNEHIKRITIYQVSIPFRFSFSHSSAERRVSDNIVLQIELGNGIVGFGETIARDYVTGESPEVVIKSIQEVFLPIIMSFRPTGFGEVLELLERLPENSDDGKYLHSARCAVELALIDAYGKLFNRTPEHLTGWLDQPYWEFPGCVEDTRYSGIIGKVSTRKAKLLARLMRVWKLKDIKVKIGDEQEFERVASVLDVYGSLIEKGHARIRVDANGGWEPDELEEKIDILEELGVLYLEQPTDRRYDEFWKPIQHSSAVNLIADESLIDMKDAERLTKEYTIGIFNVRVAKNGGLLPSMKLIAYAYSKGIEVQIGCMVGELGILNRAGQWLLALLPEVLFAEGNYNRLLLKDDIVTKSGYFKFGGKIPLPTGPGLGVEVNPLKLKKYQVSSPISIVI